MRIGLFVESPRSIDDLVGRVRQAEADGYASAWMAQIFSLDALTALAVAGREVPRIELGTAVVPTYPRHPMMLAGQALTTQAASGGRLALGIGLSHQVVIEGMFGYSFEKPARHMREYLSILLPLLRGEAASFEGATLKGNGALDVDAPKPVPVLLAALAPRMLELAGSLTDGTCTWMTGPKTLETHIVPSISKAAEGADRSAPRIVAALPVCVSEDTAGARERAAKTFEVYGFLPSYRAMLDREGAQGPADVAIVGDESAVEEQIDGMITSGATEFVAAPYGNREERERTNAFLTDLAGRNR
jgi:F420-dependent oxidoreductase-like protein